MGATSRHQDAKACYAEFYYCGVLDILSMDIDKVSYMVSFQTMHFHHIFFFSQLYLTKLYDLCIYLKGRFKFAFSLK